MTTTTATDNATLVGEGFAAFAAGDVDELARRFRTDATWNHRNRGRFGGVKQGFDAIMAFFGESAALTDGTLRPTPERLVADGELVFTMMHVTATRPDGRRLDDHQIVLFRVVDGKIAGVDQYIGDPVAVEAFWA